MLRAPAQLAPSKRPRRAVAMGLIILVSVILTGLVIGICWSAGVQSQTSSHTIKLLQANAAAESAAQAAVWQFKNDNTWRQTTPPANLPTITIGPTSFLASTTCIDAGATATLYWPFNEGSGLTTADTSGNGNTGQLYGGVSWCQGRFGNALQFDGQSGYVDAGNSPSVNITGSITMAAWIKLNTAAQDQKVGGNQDDIAGGYKLAVFGLKPEFEIHDASNNWSGNRNVPGGTILATGVWYHVAGVYDASAGTISTYVNGVLDRTGTGFGSAALGRTNGTLQIGREPWVTGGNNRYFNGIIDDVRIYNRPLSAQELRTLANTSVFITSTVTQQTTSPHPVTSAVSFYCSAPAASPPIAPAFTVGGQLAMNNLTVAGDVQSTGNVSVNGPSAINGKLNYSGTFSDPNHNLTLTYQGKNTTPTATANLAAPTINYANMAANPVATVSGGSNQNFTFNNVNNGINIIVVNGNCTDPVITTNATGGTLLITGNLTITKAATWGSAGLPVYIVVQGSINQTAPLNLNGALYAKGNWTHTDANIAGDVCIGGNVIDNTVTASSITVSSIPWFDPRASAAPVPNPMFYSAYQGANP